MEGYGRHHRLVCARRQERGFWIVLSLIATVWLSLAATASASSENFSPVAFSRSESTRNQQTDESAVPVSYFTILGAVERSAVYCAPGSTALLGELVDRAGGLSSWASPVAHIISSDQKVRHVVFRAGSHETVKAGEIVVFHRMSGPSPEDVVMTAEGVPAIHVAFMNLLADRPVVVPLDLSKATISRLGAVLSQAGDFADNVKLFRKNCYEAPLTRLDGRMPLLSGDVLLLTNEPGERGQSQQVLGLPEALPLRDHLTDSKLTTEKGSTESALNRGTLSVVQADSWDEPASPTLAEKPSSENEGLSAEQGGPHFDLSTGTAVEAIAEQWNAEAPAPPSEVTHSRGRLSDPSANVEGAIPIAPLVARPRETKARVPMGVRSHRQVELSQEPSTASSVNGLAAGVLALSLLCFAISLIWSRFDRDATTTNLSFHRDVANRTIPSARCSLDDIIENRLPLLEEEIRLPDGLTYFGRVLGRQRLIVNQREELSGPHFASQTADTSSSSSSDDGVPIPLPIDEQSSDGRPGEPAPTEPRIRNHTAHRNSGRERGEIRQPHPGLLERVLVAMEREKKR